MRARLDDKQTYCKSTKKFIPLYKNHQGRR